MPETLPRPAEQVNTHNTLAGTSQSFLQNALYDIQWQPQALTKQATARPRRWLIFADTQGIGETVADMLNKTGAVCQLVFAGQRYERRSPSSWIINPGNAEDFQRILAECLPDRESMASGILHCWSIQESSAGSSWTAQEVAAQVERGCRSALLLIQAALNRQNASLPSLWLITTGAVAVTEEDNIHPTGLTQSPLWGMGSTLALEHPELACVQIDISPDTASQDIEALCDELTSPRTHGEPRIALRHGQRYAPRLEQSRINAASHLTYTRTSAFRQDGTYLITGGLGGIGLAVARWMVKRGARRLALLGRSAPSETAAEILAELTTAGAQITLIQADVSYPEQIRDALAQIENSGKPLRGVIHCAGVFADQLLLRHRWELFEQVFAPKVLGTWNLHTLTQQTELDFFVLFSTAASMLGAAGLSNYVAANSFLDRLAHYRRAHGLPAISINWGAWKKVGMALTVGGKRESQWAVKGLNALAPQLMLDALDVALGQRPAQIGVFSVDWPTFLRQFDDEARPQFFEAFSPKHEHSHRAQQRFLQQFEAMPFHTRREFLLRRLGEQVAEVLGISSSVEIDLQRGFFDMGMDSLTSMELRNRLQSMLECSLPTTIAFKYPTVESLGNYVLSEILSREVPAVSSQKSLKPSDIPCDKLLNEVKQLSEQELEAIIAQEFGDL